MARQPRPHLHLDGPQFIEADAPMLAAHMERDHGGQTGNHAANVERHQLHHALDPRDATPPMPGAH